MQRFTKLSVPAALALFMVTASAKLISGPLIAAEFIDQQPAESRFGTRAQPAVHIRSTAAFR